jgi:hypothetical protein
MDPHNQPRRKRQYCCCRQAAWTRQTRQLMCSCSAQASLVTCILKAALAAARVQWGGCSTGMASLTPPGHSRQTAGTLLLCEQEGGTLIEFPQEILYSTATLCCHTHAITCFAAHLQLPQPSGRLYRGHAGHLRASPTWFWARFNFVSWPSPSIVDSAGVWGWCWGATQNLLSSSTKDTSTSYHSSCTRVCN